MGKYLKLFNGHAEYEAFIQTDEFVKPNVSHCVQENDVHYNPWVETRLIGTFNVTSTSEPTKIMNSASMSYCNDIDIDGVVQPSVVYSYQFDTTGEHTVKYTLSDPTNFQRIFQNCSGLTSVIIPNSVTSIGANSFQGCNSLTSVTIPNSVTSIGDNAFINCSGLASVTIGSGVTNIGDGTFAGCSSLTSITIPNSVTSIGDNAFINCSGLASVTIGSGVTNIGESTFDSCTSLTSVTIPDSVTSIGGSAFYGCSGLISVTIGSGVTTIGESVLSDCSSLTSVTIEATTPPTLDYWAFDDTNNCPIYVPSESVETYKADNFWSDYASRIQAIQ